MKNFITLFLILSIPFFSISQYNEIFISEYVEGSNNNKAIELFNPTTDTIDLSNYELRRYSNGSATALSNKTLPLAGIILPNQTYVIVLDKRNPSGTGAELPILPALAALADTFVDSNYSINNFMYFNGNDAIVLFNISTSSKVIDFIGKVGEDPGVVNGVSSSHRSYGWPLISVSSDSTSWTYNHTLRRKSIINIGDTNPFPSVYDPRLQWDSLPMNTFSGLGSHSVICNSVYDTIYDTICASFYVSPSGKTITSSGIYNDTINIAASCDSIFQINLILHPRVDSIYQLQHGLYAATRGASYRWFADCDFTPGFSPIPGANNRSFIPTNYHRSYSVEVTLSGCKDTSRCIVLDTNCWAAFYPKQLTSGYVYLEVDSSYGAGGLRYTWYFGDGDSAVQKYPTHTYASSGSYLVCLKINDSLSGCENYYCDSITVDSTGILRSSGFSISVIKAGTLGVNENEAFTNVKLYPNPTSGDIKVQFSEIQNNTSLSIISLNGQLMYSEEINTKNTMKIDTRNFAKGVYIVQLRSKEGRKNMKLIIQ